MSEDQGPKRISDSYRIDVPRWVLLALLPPGGSLYSFTAACVSYRLDCDAGTLRSIREYAALWGWYKKKVEIELPTIRAEIESWGAVIPTRLEQRGGQRAGGQNGGQKGDSGGDKKPANPTESAQTGDTLGDKKGTLRGTHTIHPHPTEENTRGGVGAREGLSTEASSPWNPANGWPQREEVVEFARSRGADPETAIDLFTSLTAASWKNKHGVPYEHWGYAIENALRYRTRKNGNGSHNSAGSPKSGGRREPGKELFAGLKQRAGEGYARYVPDERGRGDRSDRAPDTEGRTPVEPRQ